MGKGQTCGSTHDQYNTLLNLCTAFKRISPCLITVSYCAFFNDGRLVSTTPFTLSIVQCSRPDAMKRDNSLESWQSV